MKLPSLLIPVTALLSLRLAAAVAEVIAPPLAAADSAAPKTHTLFMGTDIDLQQGKSFYRVENVEGGSFVIKVDGQEKKIPTKGLVPMKVSHQLKLAENSITVEKLVVERGYTAGNDPNMKFIASLGASAADAQLSNTGNTFGVAMQGLKNQDAAGPGRYQMDYEQQAADAQRNFDSAAGMINSDLNSAGHSASVLTRELADEMYDAVEITFQVSSSRPLNSPYAVVIAQFSAPGAKPNEVQSWVYATELDPITAETRKVRIKQGGFPRGFEVKSYSLHLYNRGQELATSVSSKRVPLTREEAFEYVLVDYLASNKGKTLPATLAMGRLPAEMRNNLKVPALFVQVDKDGLPVAAFSDEACAHRIEDPALAAALRTLRFKPALKEGRAVAGVSRLGSS